MAYTTINKSTDYFNTKIYTGTGSSNALTGVGFQPDWTWIKSRSNTYSHTLTDAVRGLTKVLSTNSTNAEYTSATEITSFNSDGFTLGTDAGVNNNGSTFASWNWKAGGAGSSNSDGTITSTVSASTTSGFSIVKWTGTASAGTIGHGLGVAPKIVIVKRYSTSGGGWLMQNSNLTSASYVLKLNAGDAQSNDGANFNSVAPTNNHFSVYNSNNTNASGANHIAYCFAEKQGYSKFGKYIGNGNANGPFVYTGFKPAFLLLKQSSGTQGWLLVDNKRANPFNPVDGSLHPNANAAEDTSSDFFVDFTSNGFKLRDSDAQLNGSGSTYIYMAFAEAPLVGSNNVPCTAR